MERVPIDKAVMEKATNVRVLEVLYDWNDVGDWRSLADLLPPDAQGNTIQGDVLARETRGSIIVSDDGGLIATLGVDDLVIVQSGRATLVARKRPARQAQGAGREPGRQGVRGLPITDMPQARASARSALASVPVRRRSNFSCRILNTFGESRTPAGSGRW